MAGFRRYVPHKPEHILLPVKDIPLPSPAALLKKHGLRANRRLGQNFLADRNSLENIATLAQIQNTDSVLEIGPGLGSLTRYLSLLAREVVAVELDDKLDELLRDALKPYRNIRIIHGDILALAPRELGLSSNFIVAANIPYNITSAIIRHLLDSELKPRRIVLTVQKEVAERICQTPPDMSLLALSVQVYGTPNIVGHIPAKAFYPTPRVDSAVVRIEVYPGPLISDPLLPRFFELIKAGFSQKRKTLRNALSAGLDLAASEVEELLRQAGINPQRRAETLSLDEWSSLTDSYTSHHN
jgi:16S rRNA (adenine1518-N6/adenine1519-N6)-dimethyltransferase